MSIPSVSSFQPQLSDRYFKTSELADRWRKHPSTIRRMFSDQPGVLKFGHNPSQRRRPYVNLLIPERLVLELERAFAA
jgi:hypothetical protein